ncbi:MAG TPA: hypothetical protein VN520_25545 [Streptomyces sp.]|uniref:hypothetical protein n=1 Tax=Streptomyces sp. TaxID=1931 RepID=UPI002CD245EF|nr:hypothetical protein [Streptomyces sp.]HWU09702.1 hypothetical protein [Streptomyces sp.]
MPDLSFYVSPLSEEIREEGRVQGRAQGRAENILLVLGARGIAVSDRAREKITTCRDSELSRQWLVRAAVATTVEEVFGEEGPVGR